MVQAPYLSPQARHERVERLCADAGGELIEYGRSVDDEPLVAVRVPSSSQTSKRVLCCANIHGPEFVGGLVALGFLEELARGTLPRVVQLRARAEVWVAPCLNPDGYRRTWERDGRGPLSLLRPNARGVDLNRNFPIPSGRAPRAIPGAGSDQPGSPTYRGPHPLSEPETEALDRLLRAQGFHGSANLHSFMGTVIPARVTDAEHYRHYRQIVRATASAQPHASYRRLHSRWFDVFTGEQEDHQHHVHRTWAACIESFPLRASLRQHLSAPCTFWRFNPHDPARWTANDVPAVAAFLHAALDRPRPTSSLRTDP